jgi:hypothetical protein
LFGDGRCDSAAGTVGVAHADHHRDIRADWCVHWDTRVHLADPNAARGEAGVKHFGAGATDRHDGTLSPDLTSGGLGMLITILRSATRSAVPNFANTVRITVLLNILLLPDTSQPTAFSPGARQFCLHP